MSIRSPNGIRKLSACPNCAAELGTAPVGTKPPHTYCPSCGTPIRPVWWQTVLVIMLMMLIDFGSGALLGLGGLSLLLFEILFLIPAMLLAMFLLFKNIQPKYATRGSVPPSLFSR